MSPRNPIQPAGIRPQCSRRRRQAPRNDASRIGRTSIRRWTGCSAAPPRWRAPRRGGRLHHEDAGEDLVSMNGPSVSSICVSPVRTVVADSSAYRRAAANDIGPRGHVGNRWLHARGVRWLPYPSNAYCMTSPFTVGCRFEYLTNGGGDDGQLRRRKSGRDFLPRLSGPGQAVRRLSQIRRAEMAGVGRRFSKGRPDMAKFVYYVDRHRISPTSRRSRAPSERPRLAPGW